MIQKKIINKIEELNLNLPQGDCLKLNIKFPYPNYMKLTIFITILFLSGMVRAGCDDQPSNEVDWTNCNFVENP